MGSMISLRAADDTRLPVYLAEPTGIRRGSLVVLQEIFGVNPHLRSVADRFAEAGYVCYAPDLFHRIEPGIELGYGPDEVARARDLKAQAGWDHAVMDIQTCVSTLLIDHRVGVVGFCYGGTLAWLSACRGYGMEAAVCYYGGQIAAFLDRPAGVPVQMHFGNRDASIPPEDIERIRAFAPDADLHVHDGGHGFACAARAGFQAASAAAAHARTLAFLARHVAGEAAS